MLRVALCLGVSLALFVGIGKPLFADKPIDGIGPAGPIKRLHTGFRFTEGPAADSKGNVYFTDIPEAIIYRVDTAGKLTKFRANSGHANGLMFSGQGQLLACEMDGRVTATSTDGKSVKTLVEKHDGKRFNAPNDLVVDRHGGIYFTDPHFRAPNPLPQGKMGVYYLAADGSVTRLIDNLKAPNGVILSPDEKTLYVVPSLQSEMMAYAVSAPGKIGKGRIFCTLKQPNGRTGTGGDGLTVDTQGNLYITSQLGIQVYDPQGNRLGVIAIPEKPANVTFGGQDQKTLYVTARKSLYTLPMHAKGHAFPGKK